MIYFAECLLIYFGHKHYLLTSLVVFSFILTSLIYYGIKLDLFIFSKKFTYVYLAICFILFNLMLFAIGNMFYFSQTITYLGNNYIAELLIYFTLFGAIQSVLKLAKNKELMQYNIILFIVLFVLFVVFIKLSDFWYFWGHPPY